MAQLHERLADSRQQMLELAQEMKGEQPGRQAVTGEALDSGFPHSRLMRALMSKPAGVAIGVVAVAASILRPRLLLGAALRMTPMLKPALMRYLVPRLLGRKMSHG
jgi:hypothetical protein